MEHPPKIVLAADIGGTSARLALFSGNSEGMSVLAEQTFETREFSSLEAIVMEFRQQHPDVQITCASFGVAGSVEQSLVLAPNLPWPVNGTRLAAVLDKCQVLLLNDLVANVLGIATLTDCDLFTINTGMPLPGGTIAVIAAGTGLGEAIAYWDGTNYQPLPTEAGHADFAPRTDLETELLCFLRRSHGHVSYERVISGPGLVSIYQFLKAKHQLTDHPELREAFTTGDPAATIAGLALTGSCHLCVESLDLFVSCLGAEAGNLAMRCLARGGIYLGGGISPKIRAKLNEAHFMGAFCDKGRLRPLLESIPVHLILNDRTALQGAARWALLS